MARSFDHAYRPFQSGEATSEAALQALETEAGGRLPADYIGFLLQRNGGSLRPAAFDLVIPDSDFKEKVHALDYLYEVKEIIRRSQLRMESAHRNIPPGRIAIGTTVSELTLTLDISDARLGKVEAWVRDTFNVWGEGGNKSIVPLADSFSDFLGLLYDAPEDYHAFWAGFGQDGERASKLTLP